MPKRRYERKAPTHEGSQIRPLLKEGSAQCTDGALRLVRIQQFIQSGKEHHHDHSREHPQFCTRHPAVVSCPRPSLYELGLRPLGLPRCQHACSGHPWAPLKRDDAVRREVARGADRSISQVGRSRDACLVPFRLIPNGSFQRELTRLLGWLILRSGRPSLVRFDVWFQHRRQPAKVFPDGL